MTKEVRLNEKQKEAVEWDEGPLLVLAGPGTGKTQLLSSRVERILRETDASPETILCLTFTESGASNMRERLAGTLGLATARKVNIHTYHAFGSTILAAYQNYTDKFSRRLDNAIDEVTQYKIIAKIQKGLPARDILRGDKISDIISTVENAKAARLSAEDLKHIAEANKSQSAELSSEITPVMRQIEPRMKFEVAEPIYEEILEKLAAHISTEEIAPRVEPIANNMARELQKILKEESASAKPKVSPLTNWRNTYFERDNSGGWRLSDHVANCKLESLAGIMEKYEAELAESGLYDFSDMIEMAISALREDDGFRLSMSERFQHILLDEFQDTNPSQFELIKLLCDYERPDVMAVGDDDQAIYEFQGANASNLYDFQAHFGAHLVNLEQNYRSYSEIIDTAKRVAEQIEGSFSRRSGVKKLLNAARGIGEQSVARHEFISSDAEYYWVAEEIAGLVESGVKQSDIAVIMPKHKSIAPLLPYLKVHKGINVAYEKRENLFLDPKIAELISLARFVFQISKAKPAAGSLLEILAFPFWGIEPLTAIRAVNAARADKKSALDYLSDSGDAKLVQVAEFLAALAMKSYDTPLELMIDYMVGTAPVTLSSGEFRSPYLEFYVGKSGSYASFELYENLATFREQLVRHTHAEAPRLTNLIEFCDDYEMAGAALVNTSPYRDDTDAVQILTAHKSKGLEFAYVFMMSVDAQAWGKAKGNNNMLSLPKNLVHIRHTGITDDEKRRLLFVAMTRARDHLVMTNSLHDFAGKSPDRLEYLNEYAETDEAGEPHVISPYLPEGLQEVTLHYDDIDAAAKQGNLQTYWSAAYLKPEAELRSLLLERMEDYRLSATDLTTFVDIVYAGPMEFFRQRVLRAPTEPSSEAIEYGNLIHLVFEKVASEGISDDEALALFASEAEKCDLEAEDRRVLLEKGSFALKIALAEFGSVLRSPNARAELNLGAGHPVFDGIPIAGKLDHIEVDSRARTIEIYDFKTGHYHDKAWGSHATLFKYALQLSFYRFLLAASPEYANYKVTRAHILFVTPDDDGKVYDKVYDFDIDDEYMADLMWAVYNEARSLSFVDDPEMALEPDNGRGLKAIKDFCKLAIDKNKK